MHFLILTRNLTKTEYTQNWVAFEVGVASTIDPTIPVIVFTEENVDFPVPYLTHYFDAPFSEKVYGFKEDFSGAILNSIMRGYGIDT